MKDRIIKGGRSEYSQVISIKVTHLYDNSTIPIKYYLYQNYPNPFNPSTIIEFDLPKASKVTVKVFNVLGEEVATLLSDRLNTGKYSYEWSRLPGMASGIYLYRLSARSLSGEAEKFIETKKMILMR